MDYAKRHSHPNNDHGHDHEEDLGAILAPDEQSKLKLLLVNITEVMRKKITAIFDAPISSGKLSEEASQVLGKNQYTSDGQSKEEVVPELGEAKERKEVIPKMKDLEKDALDFFDKWRESVLLRLNEVVNNPKHGVDGQVQVATTKVSTDDSLQAETKIIRSNTNTDEVDADAELINLYPPTSTSLVSLPMERRILALHAVLLLLLSLENYVGPSRIVLLHLASSLHLPLHILVAQEAKVAQGLLEAAKHMSGSEETQKRSHENQASRRWKVGLAGVAGAAVIGVTGGLAAPLVAGAVGSIMGGLGLGATTAAGLLGTLAESGTIIGTFFGLYGGRMTGKMIDAYAKEVRDFAFLPLKGSKHHNPLPRDRRLRVTVCVSGWLTQKEDIITPWRALGDQSEVFALRWELEALTKLGISIESVVKSTAWSMAKKEIIRRTIFASLMEALWPLSLLKISKVVDNPFSVAKSRADKAGLVLADALINKAQGERPVTLIGYSLGARLIYSCLVSLAERRAFGLVESAVLIGAPTPSDAAPWIAMRSVVSGRLINVYSVNDHILAFIYRTSSIQYGVAGLQKVQHVPGIENFDASDMVSGHLRLQYLVGSILEKLGFEDIDMKEVEEEEHTLELLEERDSKEGEEKTIDTLNPDNEAAGLEHTVKQKVESSMSKNPSNKAYHE